MSELNAESEPTAETHREVAESMTGLWQSERERADRLEAMCDRLAERLVALPDLWRKEGRAVMFNRSGDDLNPQQRVGKWLAEKCLLPPAPCGSTAPHDEHPMPCDSGCQPDWHRDSCAIYGTCPGRSTSPVKRGDA